MTDTRPLVLLDVDGVVNALRPQPAETRNVQAGAYTISLPNYMPALVQHLTRVAEVRWCTAWRHAANRHITPLLGIEPLAVVDDGTLTRFTDWKAAAARPCAEAALRTGRPVVWIEDFYGYPPETEMPRGVVFVDTTADGSYVLRPEQLPDFLLDGWNEEEAA